MDRKNTIIACMGVLLLSSAAAGLYVHQNDDKRIKALERLVGELEERDRESVVDRRISKQMEEIAFGQQTLSEERSQEAIRQSEIAQAATLRSEDERQKAVKAQAAAERSAQEALQSAEMAERQRHEANEQRQQAVNAKLTADTLNYISLGRTLGSQSYSIYRTGDKEIGNMLAYASYLFTKDYGGDLYAPAVFQALTQSAGGSQGWDIHNGSISTVDFFPNSSQLLTVSTYGEMMVSGIHGGRLATRQLYSNKNYCFRDAFAAKSGKSYAVSHTGHLVIATADKASVLFLENVKRPFRVEMMNDGRQLLIVGERNLALLDLATDKIISTRPTGFNIICTGRRDNKPLLFDDKGRMHLVKTIDNLTDEKVPISGRVTCFASSKNEHLAAYGTADGTIWLTDRVGRVHRLVGHLSQVTKMKFNGRRLYSSSFDKKLLFWVVGENQIKPITLFEGNSWQTDFTFDNEKNFIWAAGSTGTVMQYLISLPLISQRLKNSVKRNFTRDEWNYYIGKGIPYREVKGKSE